MNCKDCLHEKICYMREICNDVEEEIKRFGCMNFVDCANVREVKDGWEWKASCKGEGDAQMSDYINRDELIKHIKDLPTLWGDDSALCAYHLTKAIVEIENAPAADVQEIKHGEWIESGYYDISCVCSCCGAEAQYTSTFKETFDYDWEENLYPTGYEEIREYIRTPFCSNCGAKMDGGKK